MDAPAPAPDLDATLAALAALGLRAATVVTRMMELEQAAAEAASTCLPIAGATPASMSEATQAGLGLDTAATALAQAIPHVEILARAFDRLSRSVRRTVALIRRLQAGWPRATAASSIDDRPAMLRRQVARGVAEAIHRDTDPETAERLTDDLAERLDDPGLDEEIRALPIEVIVRNICRDLGLTATPPQASSTPAQPPEPGARTLAPSQDSAPAHSPPPRTPHSARPHPPDP